MKHILNTKLEKTCNECGGSGLDWNDDQGAPCWLCQGSGHVATDEGKAILQLIAHNQGSLLQFA